MDIKSKILLFIILGIIVILIFLTNSFTGKSVDFQNSPSPRIIDVKCEKIYSDLVPEIKLIAKVKNFGGEGNVIITGEIDATEDKYDDIKKENVYLLEEESKEIIFYFKAEKIIDAKCFAKATLS